MFHLRLCRGLSYLGIVRATKAEPDVYVQEEEKANALVASGYFEMVTSGAEKVQPFTGGTSETDSIEDMFGEEVEEEVQEDPELMELQKKSKSELIEYAGQNGIDITGCKTKDDIYQKIVEAIARAVASRAALREG